MSNQQGMYYPQDQSPREQEVGGSRASNTDPREQPANHQQWNEPVAEAYSGYERGYGDYQGGYGGESAASPPYEREKVQGNQSSSWQSQQPFNKNKLSTKQIWLIIIAILVISSIFSGLQNLGFLSFVLSIALLVLIGYIFIFRSSGYASVDIPVQTFTVQEQSRLIVRNPAGSITLVGGQSNAIEVTGRQSAGGILGSPWDTQVNIQQQGDEVSVVASQRSWRPSRVDVTIKIPPGCSVRVEGNAGAIDVNGLDGEAYIETNAGTINVRRAVLRGNSRLKTNAGTIDFSGSLDPGSTSRLETNLGTINAIVDSNASFVLDAKTDLGTLNNQFGTTVVGTPPHARLELRTNLGTIDVKRG